MQEPLCKEEVAFSYAEGLFETHLGERRSTQNKTVLQTFELKKFGISH